MKLTFVIQRCDGPGHPEYTERHTVDGLDPQMSLLEALDRLNVDLLEGGGSPVAVESDCREGICGACGVTVNGVPHGPQPNTPTCHQRLAAFSDGASVRLEPLRSNAFPVIRDLVVDRCALDAVIEAGGHVSVPVGTAPDADALPVAAQTAEHALDFAACIGCGACVAACPNGAAHLFVGAKVAHLAQLPLAAKEARKRVRAMTAATEERFGPCSFYGECAQVCPASVPLDAVAELNRGRLWTR